MEPKFFAKQADFREWLKENHNTIEELWVGFYKRASGKPSITWPESVDEALCFGWIDGLRKSIDENSYKIRFTPRKPASHWSAKNINRVQELKALGLMQPAGLTAFGKRDEENSKQASYEQEKVELPLEYEGKIRASEKGWAYFQAATPSYRKQTAWWVMSAKKEETRLRRLHTLIDSSEKGEVIPPLKWTEKRK
jgi:uncharacterized protein YdeI (YjbR/CyaY-like superfamily)